MGQVQRAGHWCYMESAVVGKSKTDSDQAWGLGWQHGPHMEQLSKDSVKLMALLVPAHHVGSQWRIAPQNPGTLKCFKPT